MVNATLWNRPDLRFPDGEGGCSEVNPFVGPIVPLSCCTVVDESSRRGFPDNLEGIEFENAGGCLTGVPQFINTLVDFLQYLYL